MYGRGHEQGTRKQRKPARPWWAEEEEAAIRRVEAEWQARHEPVPGDRYPLTPSPAGFDGQIPPWDTA